MKRNLTPFKTKCHICSKSIVRKLRSQKRFICSDCRVKRGRIASKIRDKKRREHLRSIRKQYET